MPVRAWGPGPSDPQPETAGVPHTDAYTPSYGVYAVTYLCHGLAMARHGSCSKPESGLPGISLGDTDTGTYIYATGAAAIGIRWIETFLL